MMPTPAVLLLGNIVFIIWIYVLGQTHWVILKIFGLINGFQGIGVHLTAVLFVEQNFEIACAIHH